MKIRFRSGISYLFTICSVVCVSIAAGAADDKPADQEVKIKDIQLRVPATWKKVEPSSSLRLAQFEIPAAEGDSDHGELVISSFGGAAGGVKANVTRWVDQFQANGRRTETKTAKSPQGEYVIVDVAGTYKKPIGPPQQQKTQPMPKARMLAVILAVENKDNYFLKLTGPEKTVAAAAEALRRSFGGNAGDEKPWKSDGE